MPSKGVGVRIGLLGDPHANFSAIPRIQADIPDILLLLGDFEPARSLDAELSPLLSMGCDVWFVHGNRDTQSVAWHDFVFEGEFSRRNVSGLTVESNGLAIAGLGGVFRSKVWLPTSGDAPAFATRTEMLTALPNEKWRDGLPLRHRSSIFPEDFERFNGKRADILVCHEAPSTHRYGYRAINDLANNLGAKLVIHGHHHESYDARLPNGIRVIGLGKAEYRVIQTRAEGEIHV